MFDGVKADIEANEKLSTIVSVLKRKKTCFVHLFLYCNLISKCLKLQDFKQHNHKNTKQREL